MTSVWRTLLTGGAVVGLTGVVAPTASVLSLVKEDLPDPLIRWWAHGLLRAANVHPIVQGLERLPKSQFVLALNHQSHFDVPLVFGSIERHLRFVAKKELFRIPIFGHGLKATGNIMVDRRHGEHDRRALSEAAKAVQERVSIVFFAEGTRSEDGVLRPFKKGAAVLAIEAGVPVVPAAIAGTRHILPKGGRSIQGGRKVALVIGEPIPTEGLGMKDREQLTLRAHDEVAKLLAQAEALVC